MINLRLLEIKIGDYKWTKLDHAPCPINKKILSITTG
ncbi:hypothetical protein A35_0008 (plasmid) [Coxiella burnetii 'MSU Goat Q177']|nr:hypothetical protein A35_0008 [Coxiella burnetii 'MSU Goat Q177']